MRSQDKRGIALGLAAVGVAVATELKKPAEERTWHGTIAGFIPYDLRRPTVDSVREKLWNPTGNFWSPQVFGVGWSPNLGRLAAQFGLLGPSAPPEPPEPPPPPTPLAPPTPAALDEDDKPAPE